MCCSAYKVDRTKVVEQVGGRGSRVGLLGPTLSLPVPEK